MKKIITIAILCLLALGAFAQSTNTYEYDNLNRLTKVTYANGAVVQYQYDNVGNRISKTVSGVDTQYTITASANPTEGGTVSGGGTYNDGTTCTVTATANTGYTFVNWTENGTQVSTDATYIFTVTGDRVLVANFIESITTQTISLSSGSNWISASVNITLADLEAALEEALPGVAGMKITSHSDGYIQYNGSMWRGGLKTLDVSQMYRIEVSSACEITVTGMPVDPAEHPVTISNGNNWIAFPLGTSMSVNNAFAGFPAIGDKISSQGNGYKQYNGSVWRGGLQTLEPGKGYIYNSTATGNKTFVFPINPNKRR